MSDSLPPDPQAALLLLRARYRAASARTPAIFEAFAVQLAAEPGSPGALADLQQELHRVRGTAGSYGLLDVSVLAEALESLVVRWTADPEVDSGARAGVVEQFAEALRRCFEQPDASGSPSG